MDNINNDSVDINKYYSLVDKNIITHLCTDNNIKNLIHLSIKTDLNPFNKSKKKWNLKSKDKLLKECATIKKKEFKEITSCLNNLSKLGNNNFDDFKNVYKKCENKIDNLHKIINCINNIDLSLSHESSINIIDNIIIPQQINENKINENKINEIKKNENKINEIKKNENKINEIKINENKINEIKINENKINENKINEIKKTTYMIDHDNKSKSNIVSFDIIGMNNTIKTNNKDKKVNKNDNSNENKIIKLSINNIHSDDSDNYLECFGNF